MSDQATLASEPQGLSPAKRKLYELMLERERARELAALEPVLPRPVDGPIPLSYAQEQLWLLDRLDGGAAYNIPLVVRLEGELDGSALAAALGRLHARHEALRTTFDLAEGRPVQRIADRFTVHLRQLDLEALPAERREAAALRLAHLDNLRPYDLERGPLLRVHLLRLAARDHVLVLNIHHIVSDVWSLSVLVRELGAFYWAERSGGTAPVAALPVQFADFATWQRRKLVGERLEELVGFWRQTLAGAPATIDLATDSARPPMQSFAGDEVEFFFADLAAPLKSLARAEGTTLFVVLLALFDTLLWRVTGQSDLSVGSPVAGRGRTELEGLIGFFVNSVVMRADLAGDPTVRALVGRVRQVVAGALAHEAMPFEKLVEALKPPRDPSRSPLFQVMFALEKPPRLEQELPELSLRPMRIPLGTSKFDLTLFTEERPDGIGGRLEYNTGLFSRASAERLVRLFGRVLRGAAADPDRRLSELELLDEAERRQLLEEWNGAGEPSAVERPVHRLFEARADAEPDRVALVLGDEQLSYGELDRRANRLAHRLRQLGVGPETVVGLACETSTAALVGILGILKAGGAYLPLDTAQPPRRRRFMVQDAAASVLVVDRAATLGEEGSEPSGANLVDLEAEQELLAGLPESTPEVAVGQANLAYVIYTSGSTGEPKGTLVRHGNVSRLLGATASWLDFGPHQVWTLFHSLAFDFSVWEIWGALAHGGRLVMVPWLTARSPADLHRLLGEQRVSVLNQTPSAFRQWMKEVVRPQTTPVSPALAWVIFGGEALDPSELAPWFDRVGDQRPRLVNMYGITETTVHVTARPLSRADCRPPARSSIGRPIDGWRVHLLDPAGRLVPVGIPGEIHVAGAGLAAGYLGRPGLTAERFVPDPRSPQPGGRSYRAGDLARWRDGGDLEYLGRADRQVKIRGFRIELGEIEAALRRLPPIESAVVRLRALDPKREEALVAWVVPRAGQAAPGGEELASALRSELPDYMVPAAFVAVESLPRTANGKLDVAALPLPATAARPSGGGAAPSGAIERALAEIWCGALGLESVGLDDNFFDLGGHSMLLVEVHGQIRERLDPSIEVVDLFQFPTVRALADRLGGGEAAASIHQASLERGRRRRSSDRGNDVAIIASSIRVTGAVTPEQFWQNLVDGVEGIERFAPEEALAVGVPLERLQLPNYVLSEAPLEGIELFDADFFGYSPREAETIDPQQRLYLEMAWEALERAGYDPPRFTGQIGVWASVAVSSYAQHNLAGYDPLGVMGDYFLRISLLTGNASDFLAQRISYHLGLTGPSVNVQTACSSSVVGVHMACESLLRHECDMALAGGTQVRVPQRMGYLYMEGGLPSPDGYCRAFDVSSQGTVHGNGLAAVVLRRLEDAIADGDRILAVIRGSAVNNDGAQRVGFTAPSVEGQTRVVAEALAASDVDPATLGFVEAHGTGTELGDSIEVSALTQAFRALTDRTGYCALGSVKSNLGHLDTSGGIVSMIKATEALRHRRIPPTLNFTAPNPKLRLEQSPFFVNAEAIDWPAADHPRRASVNSFAIGGTNVHLVLEEAPETPPSGPSRGWRLLPISARTTAALHQAGDRLAEWLRDGRADAGGSEDGRMADAAYTLSTGRRFFPLRRVVLCHDAASALEAMAELEPPLVWSHFGDNRRPAVVFGLAAGGEAERCATLAAELVRREPLFAAEIHRLGELAEGGPGERLEALAAAMASAEAPLWQGDGPQARGLRFALAYALGRLWLEWGVAPEVIGALDDSAESIAAAVALADGSRLDEALRAALAGRRLEPPVACDELLAGSDGVLLVVGLAAPEPAASRREMVLSAQPGEPIEAAPLSALGRLWSLGVELDWSAFWRGELRRRVELPTYPFERKRYWVEPRSAALGAANGGAAVPIDPARAAEPLWIPQWRRTHLPASPPVERAGEPWLLFDDGSRLGSALAQRLEQSGARVARVRPGERWRRIDGQSFELDPGRAEDYTALVAALREAGGPPRGVAHLWSLGGEDAPPERAEERGFWSLTHLSRALAAWQETEIEAETGSDFEAGNEAESGGEQAPLEIAVITDRTCEVLGDEPLDPRKAAVLAPLGALSEERPAWCAWGVDVTGVRRVGRGADLLARRVIAELGQREPGSVVAFRGPYRWVESHEPLAAPVVAPAAPREGGVYLVTDNGAGLGLEVAGWLARGRGVRLILVGPTLLEHAAWEAHLAQHGEEHPSSRGVRRLQALEAAGAELLVVPAELTDEVALAHAVGAGRERFGALHGVFHTVVELEPEARLDALSLGGWTASRRRLTSAEALVRAFDEVGCEPELGLLIGSLAGVSGGAGSAAAAAADLGLELLARRLGREGSCVWRSVAWDGALAAASGRGAADGGAIAAALFAPGREQGRVVVSALDPALTPGARRALQAAEPSRARVAEPSEDRRSRGKRPPLETPHAEPASELERELRSLWEGLFGLTGLGVDDDFYELGGHSLLAIRMVSHLRESYGIDLLLREALEVTTIRTLSEVVAKKQVTAAGGVNLESLLGELEELSEEQAVELLREE